MAEASKGTWEKLKTVGLVVLCVGYALVVMPIWAHYDPHNKKSPMIIVDVIDILPTIAGGAWLSHHYADAEKIKKQSYQWRIAGLWLLAYGVGYLILKLTIWR